jgi:hypothetical protein
MAVAPMARADRLLDRSGVTGAPTASTLNHARRRAENRGPATCGTGSNLLALVVFMTVHRTIEPNGSVRGDWVIKEPHGEAQIQICLESGVQSLLTRHKKPFPIRWAAIIGLSALPDRRRLDTISGRIRFFGASLWTSPQSSCVTSCSSAAVSDLTTMHSVRRWSPLLGSSERPSPPTEDST